MNLRMYIHNSALRGFLVKSLAVMGVVSTVGCCYLAITRDESGNSTDHQYYAFFLNGIRHLKDLVTLEPKVETDRSLGHLFPQPPYAWGSVALSPYMVGMWQIPTSGTRANPPPKPSFTEGLPHLNNGLNVVSGEQEAINRIHTILDEYYTGLREDEEKKVAQCIYYEGNKHGLDPFLLVAMIRVESSFHNFSKSDMGAKGLMQILPHVGKSIAEEADIRWDGENTLFNPRKNIQII